MDKIEFINSLTDISKELEKITLSQESELKLSGLISKYKRIVSEFSKGVEAERIGRIFYIDSFFEKYTKLKNNKRREYFDRCISEFRMDIHDNKEKTTRFDNPL